MAARVSNSVYPANISHPGHFQTAFPYSSVCFIEVCICLFSAAVPWTGGVGDAAFQGVQPSTASRSAAPAARGKGAVKATKSCNGCKILWQPQNPPAGTHPGGFCFADVHRDPPGAGAAGDQGLQALFHHGQPQWGLLSVCLSVSAIGGPCWIKPTQMCKATASACGTPKWEIGLALFLLPSFNSECRLLKAIWAGPGNVEML